jgi:hypothetical protein
MLDREQLDVGNLTGNSPTGGLSCSLWVVYDYLLNEKET